MRYLKALVPKVTHDSHAMALGFLGLLTTVLATTSVAQTCTVLKNTAFGKPGFQDLNTTDPDRVSLLSLITAASY